MEGPAVAAAADAVAAAHAAALEGVVVVGRGPALYPETFADLTAAGHGAAHLAAVADVLDPDPVELALLALAREAAGEPLPTEPLYLRRPDAVPSAARKRVAG